MTKLFLMKKMEGLLIAVLLSVTALAQSPVHFTSTVVRVNDSLAELNILAKMDSGAALFTTRKMSDDDIVSSFQSDSSLRKYMRATDSITETGKLQTARDAALQATIRFYTDSVLFKIPLHVLASQSVVVKGTFSWLAKQGDAMPSGDESIVIPLKKSNASISNISAAKSDDIDLPLLKIFWIGLCVGLIAVFTPCVFPLIPVTVSFFLKRSKTRAEGIRNALTYSISIILIYTVPTFILTKIFGDDAMYLIATSAVSNIIFFIIFMVFAVSFFGAFDLTLPGSWATKTDAQAARGGLIGLFFMALTLVIVSFSCTGPFVGSLLPQVANANSAHAGIAAVIGILGLSVGLAIPFSLCAFFPSLLHVLPKSGGWLNSVKIVFGFVELAMAMKFLSNVDLIYDWRLLDREVFLAIWIVLALLTGLYLLGKIKFAHDSEVKFISIPRLFFVILFFTFGVYLIPGLWGAPLKSLSGLLPPASTQDFDLNQLQYKIGNTAVLNATQKEVGNAASPKLYTDKLKAPLGLTAYFDLNEGMAAAKILHKPVMLDFTGHSCANCRKMENQVWSNSDVLNRLKNDFVIISLYVDENTNLPAEQVYTDKNGAAVVTLGEKNLDYEKTKFGVISQPLYMFLDLNGNPLSDEKYGYDPDVQKFIHHLDEVKQKFEEEK